jgi:hypothetical protein
VKIVKVIGIVAAVVLLGIALGWLGSRRSPTPAPAMATGPNSAPVKTEPVRSNAAPLFPSKRPSRAGVTNTGAIDFQAGNSTNAVPDWEDKLDEILVSDKEDSAKAKQMLEMFPRLPEDGQVEVAQHLSNLISDEDYPALAQYATNSSLPEAVLDVLMADALNRPNSLKLPVLLGLARDSQNPKAAEAKDVLELFLEEDYGTDWPAWQTKMDQWLKENPD